MIKDIIKQKRLHHSSKMNEHQSLIRDQIERYGQNSCDYLTSQREKLSYHTGAYNALVELNRTIDGMI